MNDSSGGRRRPDVQDVYPLTPMQGGILFHVLQAERSGPYVEQFVFDAQQVPDTERLAAAWSAVVARHPALRTAFVWEGVDEPLQVVVDECAVPTVEVDLTGQSREQAEAALDEYLAADRKRGFDLARPPLMRLAVFRQDSGAVLVWSLHHLIMDGWSMPITVGEVAAHYRAWPASPGLPEARPFRDYLAWLAAHRSHDTEEFWRAELSDLSALPLHPPAPGPESERRGGEAGGRAYHDLGTELSAALVRAARAARVTLSTVFQAAWALTIARHTGAPEAVIGVTVSGRPEDLPGADGMVGVLINTIPRRIRLDDAAPVRDWLRGIQRGYLDTLPHQHAGLPDIRRFAGLSDGGALFESIVVFENYPSENPGFDLGGDGTLRIREFIEDTGYPLTLTVMPRDDIRLQLLYDPERFPRGAATTLLGRFETVLAETAADRDAVVGGVGVLSGVAGQAAGAADTADADAVAEADGVADGGGAAGLDGSGVFDRPAARVLRDVWRQVLDRPVATAETDFFREGGDSLAAVRLIGRIRALFRAPVPVNSLFEDRSLARQLDRIDACLGGAEAADRAALSVNG